MFELIWGGMSYVAAVMAGTWLVAWRIKHRRYFWLRSVLCFAAACVLLCGYDALITLCEGAPTLYFILRMCDCLVLIVSVMLSVKFCFECDIWAVMFCTTAGYCMQHISKTLCYIAETPLLEPPRWFTVAALVYATVLVYIVFYFCVIRNLKIRTVSVDNAKQILIALIVVVASVFIYLIAMREVRAASASPLLMVLVQLFSMIIALLAFMLEFGLLANRRLMTERDEIKRFLDKESEQYRVDQNRIEAINIKCHDIKHHLSLLRTMDDKEEKEKYIDGLEQAVLFFENNIKTGNKTLDMLLSEKALQCERDHIQLSCIADGQALQFMEGLDVYSLFGNAIGNAMESVKNLQDAQKRLITLKVNVKNKFLCINIENYFENALTFEDGLPRTTKQNQDLHGFGMRSIRYTVEKYNGNLVIDTKDNIFSLGIYIPLAA